MMWWWRLTGSESTTAVVLSCDRAYLSARVKRQPSICGAQLEGVASALAGELDASVKAEHGAFLLLPLAAAVWSIVG
jgi:hypothetical protein